MISIEQEKLVRLGGVCKLLPPNERTGRPIHISAIHRWAQRGRLGPGGRCVRLETTRIGGSSYTSVEAIQRFADQLSTPRPGNDSFSSGTWAIPRRQPEITRRKVEQVLGLTEKDRSTGTA